MKQMFLFLSIIISLASFGQKATFDKYSSWDETMKSAKRSNKKVFLYFGATWCAPCVQIKKQVLPDSAIQSQLQEGFLRYEFDIDKKPAVPFLRKYRVTGVPLILILNADGFVTDRISEIPMDIPGFSSLLAEAKANKNYIKAVSNTLTLKAPAFYDEYFNNGMKKFPDSVVVDSYLKLQKDLSTEVNWNVLSLFNTNDDYFYYIKNNEKPLVDKYGMEVKFKLLEMYRRIAERYIKAKDSVRYNDIARLLTGADDSSNVRGQEAYLFRQLLFLGRTGMDWAKFVEVSRICVDRYGNNKIQFICQYALESKPNAEALDFLIGIMNPVLQTKPTVNLYFMYGTLLWYSGKEVAANEYFQKTLSSTSNQQQADFYKQEIETVKRG